MIARALEGCQLLRPEGFAGAVEIVRGDARPRAFPAHLTSSLGICVKRGAPHAAYAEGRRIDIPRDAVILRRPGCIWGNDASDVAFVSIDLSGELVPEGRFPRPMACVDGAAFADVDRAARILAGSTSRLHRDQALHELLVAMHAAAFVRSDMLSEITASGTALERARDFLISEAPADCTLTDLASMVGVNRFALIRSFRRRYGVTPYALKVQAQLERARKLMLRGAALAYAAAASGFADQSHLTRHFKRTYGVTPGAYAQAAARRTV